MAFTTCHLIGHFIETDGSSPATGTASVVLDQPLYNSGADEGVWPNVQTQTLTSGAFSIPIVCTDDVGTTPTGGTYTVTITFTDQTKLIFNVNAPTSKVVSGNIDILTVLNPPAGTGGQFILVSAEGVAGGVATLDGSTHVPLAQINMGGAAGDVPGPLDGSGHIPSSQIPGGGGGLPTTPGWVPISDLPNQVDTTLTPHKNQGFDEGAAVINSGAIYHYGGCGNALVDTGAQMGCASAHVYKYVIATDTWTRLNNYPITVENAQAFVKDSTHNIIIGGDGSGTGLEVYRHDTGADTYTLLGAAPVVFDPSVGFQFAGLVHLLDADNITMHNYDPSTDTWTTGGGWNLPFAIHNPIFVLLGTTVVRLGGNDMSTTPHEPALNAHWWNGTAWVLITPGAIPTFPFGIEGKTNCAARIINGDVSGTHDLAVIVAPVRNLKNDYSQTTAGEVYTGWWDDAGHAFHWVYDPPYSHYPDIYFEDSGGFVPVVSDGTQVFVIGGQSEHSWKTSAAATGLRSTDLLDWAQSSSGFYAGGANGLVAVVHDGVNFRPMNFYDIPGEALAGVSDLGGGSTPDNQTITTAATLGDTTWTVRSSSQGNGTGPFYEVCGMVPFNTTVDEGIFLALQDSWNGPGNFVWKSGIIYLGNPTTDIRTAQFSVVLGPYPDGSGPVTFHLFACALTGHITVHDLPQASGATVDAVHAHAQLVAKTYQAS